jgi:dihydroorotase
MDSRAQGRGDSVIRIWLLALIAAILPAQEIYDLLLKNGHVIDLANGRNGKFDIAVTGTKIVRVATDIPSVQARVVVEAGGYYVTPGLIDIYTHLGPLNGIETVQPDHNTLPYGVTTAVDAGSSPDFAVFRKTVLDHARVRVLAFVDATGDAGRTIQQNPQTVVGIKVATAEALDAALKTAQQAGTIILMDAPPAPEAAKHLRPGDIQTHIFAKDTSEPALQEARKRGVLLDVGHGRDSFLYRVASPALRQGLLPDTISTGMEGTALRLPRANMTATLSKFLNLGLTMEQLIERTTVNAAKAIHHPELGTLTEGSIADIALLAVEKGSFGFLDSAHTRLAADRQVRCVLTVRNGRVVWDSDGLFAPDSERIGPYSNFK